MTLADDDLLTLPLFEPGPSCSNVAPLAARSPIPTPAPEPVPVQQNVPVTRKRKTVLRKKYTTEDLRRQFYLKKIKIANFELKSKQIIHNLTVRKIKLEIKNLIN